MSNRALAKSIGSMSFAVLLSRFLGLARDIIFAGFFGASFVADAFQVGYQIPNLLRKLFGEGALSAAFIPIYNEFGISRGKKEQISFALNILSLLMLLLIFLTAIGMLFAPFIVRLIAPGFDEQTAELTSKLTRIMFPYLLLIGLSSTLISILNSHNYFFIPGLSSAFLNVGMIGSLGVYALFFHSTVEEKIVILSFGVLIGGVLQTAVNLPLLKKLGYNFTWKLNFKGEALKQLWYRFLPGVAGLAIREINLAVDLILASFLISGSIAALQYGNRLMQMPLGIFGISVSSVILPLFSRYIPNKEWKQLSERLRFSFVTLIYLMLPITVIFIALGKDIVRLIFMRGAFDVFALEMTFKALVFYSLGLVFYALVRTLIPIFYAAKDTKTPVIISAIVVFINIILNIILMQFLQHSGLALASSLSSMIHLLILFHILKKKIPEIKIASFIDSLFKIIAVSAFIYIVIAATTPFFPTTTTLQLLLKISLYLTLAPLLYYLGTKLLKVDYINGIEELLWRKFSRR